MDRICNCGCQEPLPANRQKPFLKHHDKNRLISCACGCGEQFYERNKWGAKRKYVNHHAMQHVKIYDNYAEAQKARRTRNRAKAVENNNLDPPRFIVKECNACGQRGKHFFNCHFKADGSPEYKTKCNMCMRGYNSQYRKKNRKRFNAQAVARKRKRKQKCIEYKGGACEKCNFIGSGREMTFHHLPGVNKVKDISQMLDWSWVKLQAELDKCILLCFRCHMKTEDILARNLDSH